MFYLRPTQWVEETTFPVAHRPLRINLKVALQFQQLSAQKLCLVPAIAKSLGIVPFRWLKTNQAPGGWIKIINQFPKMPGFLILFMGTMHSWAANESSWFHDHHPKIRPSPRWISSTSKLFIFVFAGWITVESLFCQPHLPHFFMWRSQSWAIPKRSWLLGHGFIPMALWPPNCFIPMAIPTPNLGPMAIVHLILGGDRHPSHRLFFSPEILQNNMRIHGFIKKIQYMTEKHDDMGPMGHPFSWGIFLG